MAPPHTPCLQFSGCWSRSQKSQTGISGPPGHVSLLESSSQFWELLEGSEASLLMHPATSSTLKPCRGRSTWVVDQTGRCRHELILESTATPTILMCCKAHQSTSYIVSLVMLYIQQQGCVDVDHDAKMVTLSSGDSSITQIALCFNILPEPLIN